jgi:hypothetical protein
MGLTFPESSIVEPPFKADGDMSKSKESFYELAKSKIKYLTDAEFKVWSGQNPGINDDSSNATYILSGKYVKDTDGNVENLVTNLEIAINRDAFIVDGEDYSDVVPFVVEHEIFEIWLTAKKGIASGYSIDTKHHLALRRSYQFARGENMVKRLYEYCTRKVPENKNEHDQILRELKIVA